MVVSAIVALCQYFKKYLSVILCTWGNARVSETMSTAAEAITKPLREPAFRKPTQTKAARRRRALIDGLTKDLGHEPNTSERALIEQVAGLVLMREAMEQAVLRGELVNAAEITKISGAVTRSFNTLRPKGGKRHSPPPLTMRERILRDRRAT
jgi:hypothetical protein